MTENANPKPFSIKSSEMSTWYAINHSINRSVYRQTCWTEL